MARAPGAGVEGAVIVGKLLEKSEEEALGGRLGYNAATGEFEDLVKAGVIDPLKVCPQGQYVQTPCKDADAVMRLPQGDA